MKVNLHRFTSTHLLSEKTFPFSAGIAERRANDKALGRFYKSVINDKKAQKNR